MQHPRRIVLEGCQRFLTREMLNIILPVSTGEIWMCFYQNLIEVLENSLVSKEAIVFIKLNYQCLIAL